MVKKRLITALLIGLMKWNGCNLVVCKRNDILLNLMNKYGLSLYELEILLDSVTQTSIWN